MYKYLIILLLLASTSTATITDQSKDCMINIIYDDIIMSAYNSSYIETANYQYLRINNTDEINITEGEPITEFIGNEILVKEIKEINKNTLIADIKIL